MGYIFSASKNAFYPLDKKRLYVNAGSWPDDGEPVSDDTFIKYSGSVPAGKMRGSINGLPAWVDVPPPTDEEIKAAVISEAVRKKSALLAEASRVIQGWQTDLLLGTISESDKTKLIEWRAYIKA
ncbi:tail fiber assembly protein, partial [Citrobacter portucalensis]|uniref:tail fiber assembly protein n=1 Tax=Citrobacter portucalensis TaxID=1639133 RepID=UPI00226B503B